MHSKEQVNRENQGMSFSDRALTQETATMSKGFDEVNLFANDDASTPVLELLQ